jgi:general secretion pathway protein A
LLTPGLLDTLVDHAGGNHRTLMAHAHELLLAGAERERPQLDEQLFFDLFAPPASERARPRPSRAR